MAHKRIKLNVSDYFNIATTTFYSLLLAPLSAYFVFKDQYMIQKEKEYCLDLNNPEKLEDFRELNRNIRQKTYASVLASYLLLTTTTFGIAYKKYHNKTEIKTNNTEIVCRDIPYQTYLLSKVGFLVPLFDLFAAHDMITRNNKYCYIKDPKTEVMIYFEVPIDASKTETVKEGSRVLKSCKLEELYQQEIK